MNLAAKFKRIPQFLRELPGEIRKLPRRLKKVKASQVFLYIFVIALVTFTAIPLIYVVSTAFKPINELFLYPPRYLVKNPTLSNFTALFTALSSSVVPFTRYLFNSLFTSSITVLGAVILSSLGAYGITRFNPPGSKFIMAIVLAALMFPAQVTQIPNYLVVRNLGLINSYWALIIPKIAVAYNFFLMERFAGQIPRALIEAANIDGANEWTTFWRIAMPILKPAWATLIVLTFISNWNDAFSPLVYINQEAMKTLPLAISTIAGGVGVSDLARAGAVSAVTLLMLIPTITVYTAMQSQVMKTMAFSGIK